MECQKHKLKKGCVFCLETGCRDRLVCEKCIMIDKQHCDHQRICIKYFMENDQDELVSIFNEVYAQTVKDSHNVKQFSKVLDARFEKFLDEREEAIRLPFEKMISNYRLSLQKLKTRLCQKYKVDEVKSITQIQQAMQQLIENDSSEQKQKEMKEMIDSCNQIISIQKELESTIKQIEQNDEQMVKGIQQVIDNQRTKFNLPFENTTNDLESAKQLQQQTQIDIDDFSKMEQYRNQINQYQQQNKQFRIWVFFQSIVDPNHRSQVISMIDQLNANHRVGYISILINNDNKNDVESLTKIVNNYTNIFWIQIYDYLNQVDNSIHNLLKRLVRERTIIEIQLSFLGDLKNSNDGLDLLKQFNQAMVKDKDHLGFLGYSHSKINRNGRQKQEIEGMINEVCNM